ncbi:SirA family protein [Magnetococcus marinus MC-1]|uniref:SirA family protein n=2 Tax=Magnetococcus TaxID=162171 RepID=A0LCE6_MAGMM|nr:SirA family protein [Magnetococcus marinus MC-1]
MRTRVMMSQIALKNLAPDGTVDARNLLCPMPILKAESGMMPLKRGEILAVRATDRGIEKDLPAWSDINGHQFLGFIDEPGEKVGLVRKG